MENINCKGANLGTLIPNSVRYPHERAELGRSLFDYSNPLLVRDSVREPLRNTGDALVLRDDAGNLRLVHKRSRLINFLSSASLQYVTLVEFNYTQYIVLSPAVSFATSMGSLLSSFTG